MDLKKEGLKDHPCIDALIEPKVKTLRFKEGFLESR